MFVGMTLGAFFWGQIADRFGRKTAFMWTLMISGLHSWKFNFNLTLLLYLGIFGLAAAFSPNFYVLMALIFVMGFGIGGNLPCVLFFLRNHEF